VAAELANQQPAGTRYPATEIEHRNAGADSRPASKVPDLAGTHEPFLTHVLAGRKRGFPGSLEG
jgi:hypothetical protein